MDGMYEAAAQFDLGAEWHPQLDSYLDGWVRDKASPGYAMARNQTQPFGRTQAHALWRLRAPARSPTSHAAHMPAPNTTTPTALVRCIPVDCSHGAIAFLPTLSWPALS